MCVLAPTSPLRGGHASAHARRVSDQISRVSDTISCVSEQNFPVSGQNLHVSKQNFCVSNQIFRVSTRVLFADNITAGLAKPEKPDVLPMVGQSPGAPCILDIGEMF
ncbi:MAG TPA: hypothetical protein VMO26_02080 [Vicinamibacterales bacterium]|nr:hypothetical protein [Vicinamibacterales bacterium]